MGTLGVYELPTTELRLRNRHWAWQTAVCFVGFWHELTLSDCRPLSLLHFSMILWPNFLHPITIYYLASCLILHYYTCHNRGQFKNSHNLSPKLPPEYLNIVSSSPVPPSCFGPGNHHFCWGYWNSSLILSPDLTLQSQCIAMHCNAPRIILSKWKGYHSSAQNLLGASRLIQHKNKRHFNGFTWPCGAIFFRRSLEHNFSCALLQPERTEPRPHWGQVCWVTARQEMVFPDWLFLHCFVFFAHFPLHLLVSTPPTRALSTHAPAFISFHSAYTVWLIIVLPICLWFVIHQENSATAMFILYRIHKR